MLGAYLGADMALNERVLIGAMLSRNGGDADFTLDNNGNSGRYMLSVVGLHPYLDFRSDGGSRIWATVGFGRGEVEITSRTMGWRASDVRIRNVGAGLDRPMARSGAVDWTLKADVSLAAATVAGGGANRRDLDIDVSRARLAMEAAWNELPMQPYIEFGGRRDSGDGETGSGFELGAGLRLDTAAGWRVNVEARRVAGGAGVEGHEISGGIVKTSASGRGLSLSLRPSYGPAGGLDRGVKENLWRSAKFRQSGGYEPGGYEHRWEMELGYGLSTIRGRPVQAFAGMTARRGGVGLTGERAPIERARVGVDYDYSPALKLKLEYRWRANVFGAAHGPGSMSGLPPAQANIALMDGYGSGCGIDALPKNCDPAAMHIFGPTLVFSAGYRF